MVKKKTSLCDKQKIMGMSYGYSGQTLIRVIESLIKYHILFRCTI